MAAAVSLIRVEKPHSLSYQESTRPRPPSTNWVCGRATVEDAGAWLKSMETSGSLVTARMPFSRGGFEGGVHLFDRDLAGRHEVQVDHRDVGGRHADRRAVELALQGRDHQAQRLGGARGGGDHRHGRGACAVEVLVHRVQRRLVAGVGVDGGHVAALDAAELLQHVGHRRQAVGGARRVRDDQVVPGQRLVVHAVDDGLVDAVAGSGDDHALGAGFQVGGGLVLGGEEAGALKRDVDVERLVRQVLRIADRRDLDLAEAAVDPVLAGGHRAGKPAVDAVVAQQVGVGLDRAEVVDRHHLDVLAAMFDDRAQDEPADAAETVDGDANGHVGQLLDGQLELPAVFEVEGAQVKSRVPG